MATKRPAPEDNSSRSLSSSGKRHKPNLNNPHAARPNHGKHSFKKAHPVNDLKSTIRSIRRLLDRNDDLPAGVRVDKERELQTARHELERQQRAKKRSEIIGKWHKVRFFERQKAERRLKRARKALREVEERVQSGAEVGEAKEVVEEAELEVAYAMFFPLERDYVPLFRKKREDDEGGKDGDGDEEKTAKRYGDEEMWEVVKRCRREGKLQDLRDGRLESEHVDEADEVVMESVKVAKNRAGDGPIGASREGKPKSTRLKSEEDSDDEKGGAFFE